ncbi:MAG: hypothetical protein PHQ75_02415 [Thermoguttaceae bacterium]|nr:hypothetical protein [Thermoguttaceae bacterium]
MKNQMIKFLVVVVALCASMVSTPIRGQENEADPKGQTPEVKTIEAAPLYGSDLNDPRIPAFKIEAKKSYVNPTWTGWARNGLASVFYGDTLKDVQLTYTIEYQRNTPLQGRVIGGFECMSTVDGVKKNIDMTGCKAYREDVLSPWLLDYTSLNKSQIQEIRRIRGLE